MTNLERTPLIALIGLPNAGKSTLMNKLTGTKKAITAREAHTTRDLNYAETEWEGYFLRFVDTGGLVPDPEDVIQKEIQIKSASAIAKADLLVWVIDRRQDPDTIRDELMQRIWKTGKPTLICINKVDDPNNDKDISEYAKLGGFGFVNVSSYNGYGINVLLDMLVEQVQDMGFEPTVRQMPVLERKKRRKTKVPKEVRQREDGGFYVVRNSDETGPGLFQTIGRDQIKHPIQNVIFDWHGVSIHSSQQYLEQNESVYEAIKTLKEQGKKIYYLSNYSKAAKQAVEGLEIYDLFEGGFISEEIGVSKPDFGAYQHIIEAYELDPETTVFVDDASSNVDAARAIGLWGVEYHEDLPTDVVEEVSLIEHGYVKRIPRAPKLLLLGRPNVGKSTLFNALAEEDVQIVTDVAGTTLSVNDTIVEHAGKEYVLLDTAGIRKAGQRTFGSESFATYRTIQASYEADVILFMVDATQPLTHQDQVVAGIVKEAKKGVVIIANKADIADSEQRKRFLRDFMKKFNFLKVESFVWLSAKGVSEGLGSEELVSDENNDFAETIVDIDNLWEEIDRSLRERKKAIDPQEVRKLFNFLMKKKPPKKLRNKKRPVCYDLLYTKSSPPTFELLIKDKSTVHWSYVRFLENIIRNQFRFTSTSIVVKLTYDQ
jgi:HAD superfamily hydrolase (TIGR01509 family)